jgi:hypothetical protein
MAEIYANSGESSDSVFVPSPVMTGEYIPAMDTWRGSGLGLKYGWGTTSGIRKMADQLVSGGSEADTTATAQLASLVAVMNRPTEVRNYYLDGLIGPPGPAGPVGPSGVGLAGLSGLTGIQGATGATGASAFSDIDIPIPFDGWEGAFTNNSPGAGSVAWTSFKVSYQGTDYTIAAGNTANTWLYWSLAAPTVVSSSNTRTDAVGTSKWFIGANNAGAFEQSQFIKLVTSGLISVTQLSALAADLGAITAGTITMNLGTTYRLQLSPSGLRGSVDSGSTWFNIIALDGTNVLIQGSQIKADSITTSQLQIGSASNYKVNNVAGPSAYTSGDSTVSTLSSFICSGSMVSLRAQASITCTNSPVDNVALKIFRDTSEIYTESFSVASGSATVRSVAFEDFPGAGTYTYTFKLNGDINGGSTSDIRFRGYELLR